MSQAIMNRLAETYDVDMENADHLNVFPYDGYQLVLDVIARELSESFHLYPISILDLGIGTGKLYQQINPFKMQLTGIDFSANMLQIAKMRVPNAVLIEHDLMQGLPTSLEHQTFDAIVSTYFFHSFSMDHFLQSLEQLSRRLNKFGKIFIGDAMFLTSSQKRSKQLKELSQWNEFAHYHVYEQIINRIPDHLCVSFFEVQTGAAVLIIENYHECTLQNRELLIKY